MSLRRFETLKFMMSFGLAGIPVTGSISKLIFFLFHGGAPKIILFLSRGTPTYET
jgi:hypothetical protein